MTDRALVGNAADPKQVKKAKRLAKLERERDLDDLRFVVSTERGRRWIWRRLCECAVFSQTFYPGQPDMTAFNEGRRRVGLGIMVDLGEIDPALYHRMAVEAKALEEAFKIHPEDISDQDSQSAKTDEEENES